MFVFTQKLSIFRSLLVLKPRGKIHTVGFMYFDDVSTCKLEELEENVVQYDFNDDIEK